MFLFHSNKKGTLLLCFAYSDEAFAAVLLRVVIGVYVCGVYLRFTFISLSIALTPGVCVVCVPNVLMLYSALGYLYLPPSRSTHTLTRTPSFLILVLPLFVCIAPHAPSPPSLPPPPPSSFITSPILSSGSVFVCVMRAATHRRQ